MADAASTIGDCSLRRETLPEGARTTLVVSKTPIVRRFDAVAPRGENPAAEGIEALRQGLL